MAYQINHLTRGRRPLQDPRVCTVSANALPGTVHALQPPQHAEQPMVAAVHGDDRVANSGQKIAARGLHPGGDRRPADEAAIRIVAWATRDMLRPTGDDFAMLRLVLLALLPQIGGILLMVGRAERPS